MIKFSIPIFLHFRTQQVFPRFLAKFQSITNIRTRGFWTFISENLRPPLISLVPSGENDVIFSKIPTRVKIIITISTAIRIKNNKNLGSYIRAIFDINCYDNFNPCGIFEKMTSFSPILNQDLEQGKLMAGVNSRK